MNCQGTLRTAKGSEIQEPLLIKVARVPHCIYLTVEPRLLHTKAVVVAL